MDSIRTIFQLIVACLTMSLSIPYCISYADMFARFLNDELDPDTGGLAIGFLVSYYLFFSVFFVVFSAQWIGKNSTRILCCYFTTVFVINIIVYHFTNKTTI